MRLSAQLTTLFLLFSLYGCAIPPKATISEYSNPIRVEALTIQTPENGVRSKAYIGDSVLKLESLAHEVHLLGYATPTETLKINVVFDHETFEKGEQYPIWGKVGIDDSEFFAVITHGGIGTALGILVSEDGSIYNKAVNMGPLNAGGVVAGGVSAFTSKGVVYPVTEGPTPPEARLVPVVEKKNLDRLPDGMPSTSFDLVYFGQEDDTLRFNYREFSGGRSNLPSFNQEFTFPKDAKSLRFKSFDLVVHKATKDFIDYTVTTPHNSPEQ